MLIYLCYKNNLFTDTACNVTSTKDTLGEFDYAITIHRLYSTPLLLTANKR